MKLIKLRHKNGFFPHTISGLRSPVTSRNCFSEISAVFIAAPAPSMDSTSHRRAADDFSVPVGVDCSIATQANYRWVREKKKMKEQKEYRERQTRRPGDKDNRPNKVWTYIYIYICAYT